MKCVKTLSLAAVAAAALMALVGVSSASATVLCKTAPNAAGTCALGWAYEGEIHMVSTEKWRTTSTFKTIECDESTVAGTPSNEGSATETVSGPVAVLTATGHCTCTVVIVQKGTFEIHASGDVGNGTLTSNGMTETVSCSTIFGVVHCNYVTENDNLGTLTGGSDVTITITIDAKREDKTSGLCDEEATWHVKYTITTPSSLWVATST